MLALPMTAFVSVEQLLPQNSNLVPLFVWEWIRVGAEFSLRRFSYIILPAVKLVSAIFAVYNNLPHKETACLFLHYAQSTASVTQRILMEEVDSRRYGRRETERHGRLATMFQA